MKKLLIAINKEKQLKNDKLYPLFLQAQHIVRDCVNVLVLENDHVQKAILDLGADILSNTDRHRVIFFRKMMFSGNQIVENKTFTKQQNKDFLCKCMDLGQSLIEQNVLQQASIVKNLNISRIILERIVNEYKNLLFEPYKALCMKQAEAIIIDSPKLHEIAHEVYQFETIHKLDPQFGYGLLQYINTRMDALKSIEEQITKSFLRLLYKVTQKLSSGDINFLDNFQYGALGLSKAIASYDPIATAHFSGYAKWLIRQKILFNMKEGSNVIKISQNTWQNHSKLEATQNRLALLYGPCVDTELLAKESGFSTIQVETMKKSVSLSDMLSIDYPVNTDSDESFAEFEPFFPDDPEIDLSDLLRTLPVIQQKLICLRYGIIVKNQIIDEARVKKEVEKQNKAGSYLKLVVKGV